MCNLYDIGPARRAQGDRWEASLAGGIGRLATPFGRRKTDPAPVVLLRESGEPSATVMRWGFERPYNPAVNNARIEKLDGPWAGPWRERRRCLVPMSAWYEWSGPAGGKQTFAFTSTDGLWLWAGGLWEEGPAGPAFTLLTRPAAPELAFVHDRMPALLEPNQFDVFLSQRDPRDVVAGSVVPVTVFRCHNPLLDLARHRGPEPMEMLPGF